MTMMLIFLRFQYTSGRLFLGRLNSHESVIRVSSHRSWDLLLVLSGTI